ncbi:MAG TPA: peptide ABC transporter substrate-binding protein [Candidatus Paceibacterota bacterium]|nr:peptide ABC transporter substrate-binding protein [Candidatus Paceibacterota bacterium]
MAFLRRVPKRFSRTRFVFFLVACVLISGCARREPPADITIINQAEPETLDPALLTGIPEMRIAIGLFEGLARLDPKTARPIPGLAKSWDISPDGKIYTFHLRTNLVWSTGGPITADDVVYSWIRTLAPATASDYAGQLFYVTNAEDFNAGKIKDPSLVGIHALDKFTVRVELNSSVPFFLDICAMPLTYVVPRQTIEKYGDRWLMARPLPVSGPYELAYWRLNDKVRLIKNPRYWDAAHTQSGIIDILPIGSPSTAFDLYEQGAVDIIWDKETVPAELLDILRKRPDVHPFNYLATYWVSFNVTRKPFDNPLVRKALALAVDRERIVKKITRGGERPVSHLVPDGTADYTSPPGLDYNPALAKKLLAEAGYPGGRGFPRFEYIFNAPAGGGDNVHEDIAIELQQMWHDTLGINMDLRQVEWKVWLSETAHLDYDVGRGDWIGDYDDANTFLDLFLSNSGNNRTGWKNARYDELVNEANAQTDLKKREELFQQAESILIQDELPIIPLYIYAGINYYHTNITGIYQNILDDHPLNYIRKTGRGTKVGGRRPEAIQSN